MSCDTALTFHIWCKFSRDCRTFRVLFLSSSCSKKKSLASNSYLMGKKAKKEGGKAHTRTRYQAEETGQRDSSLPVVRRHILHLSLVQNLPHCSKLRMWCIFMIDSQISSSRLFKAIAMTLITHDISIHAFLLALPKYDVMWWLDRTVWLSKQLCLHFKMWPRHSW